MLQKKEQKKLGRPVTFRGDPESSQLSDGERKRIKRRIANRESARRVRHKRQVLMEELHCKVSPSSTLEGTAHFCFCSLNLNLLHSPILLVSPNLQGIVLVNLGFC